MQKINKTFKLIIFLFIYFLFKKKKRKKRKKRKKKEKKMNIIRQYRKLISLHRQFCNHWDAIAATQEYSNAVTEFKKMHKRFHDTSMLSCENLKEDLLTQHEVLTGLLNILVDYRETFHTLWSETPEGAAFKKLSEVFKNKPNFFEGDSFNIDYMMVYCLDVENATEECADFMKDLQLRKYSLVLQKLITTNETIKDLRNELKKLHTSSGMHFEENGQVTFEEYLTLFNIKIKKMLLKFYTEELQTFIISILGKKGERLQREWYKYNRCQKCGHHYNIFEFKRRKLHFTFSKGKPVYRCKTIVK